MIVVPYDLLLLFPCSAPGRPVESVRTFSPMGIARRNLFGGNEQSFPRLPAPAGCNSGIAGLTALSEAATLVTMAPSPLTVTAALTTSQPAGSTSPGAELLRGNECAQMASPLPRTPRRYAHSFALFLRKVSQKLERTS